MPHKSDLGWDWFAPSRAAAGEPDHVRRLAIARAFARIFSGGDGELALDHLRSLTVERCLGPESSDAALRCMEGRRSMVHHILSLVRTGRDGDIHSDL